MSLVTTKLFTPFPNRYEAGRFLAERLVSYRGRNDVVVLALPRGGVPVAAAITQELDLPLDIFVVRKLGVPGHEELAMGAIASGGVRVLNHEIVDALAITDEALEAVAAHEQKELERREFAYRGGRAPLDVEGRTVILVDDGLATGASMLAAIRAVRARHPARVVAAVPAAPRSTCIELARHADEIHCAVSDRPFVGVGSFYEDFSETTDDEVRDLLSISQPPDEMNHI